MSTKLNQYWRLLRPDEIIKEGDEFFHEECWWPSIGAGLSVDHDNPENSPYRRLETLPEPADEQWHPASETPTKFPVVGYWRDPDDVGIINTESDFKSCAFLTVWKPFTPPPPPSPTKSPEELAKEEATKHCAKDCQRYILKGWDAAAKFYKSVK